MSLTVALVFLFFQRANLAILFTGSEAVFGEDTNSNTIRDDVDKWILEQDYRRDVIDALKQYARVYRKIHLKPYNRDQHAIDIYEYDRSYSCLVEILDNNSEQIESLLIMDRIGRDEYKKMKREHWIKVREDNKVAREMFKAQYPNSIYRDLDKIKKGKNHLEFEKAKKRFELDDKKSEKLIKDFKGVINNSIARKKLYKRFKKSRKSGVYTASHSPIPICDFELTLETLKGEMRNADKKKKVFFDRVVSGDKKILWCQYCGRDYTTETVASNFKYQNRTPSVTRYNNECFNVEFLSVQHFMTEPYVRGKKFKRDGLLVQNYDEFLKYITSPKTKAYYLMGRKGRCIGDRKRGPRIKKTL